MPDRVANHIASCDRCTRYFEQETAPSDDVKEALTDIMTPPPDFVRELGPKVLAEVQKRRSFGVITDLFGAGWDTVWLLSSLENDHGDE